MRSSQMAAGLLSVLAMSVCSSCTFSKIVWHNFSGIGDYKIFPNRELKASQTPFHFVEAFSASRVPEKISCSA